MCVFVCVCVCVCVCVFVCVCVCVCVRTRHVHRTMRKLLPRMQVAGYASSVIHPLMKVGAWATLVALSRADALQGSCQPVLACA